MLWRKGSKPSFAHPNNKVWVPVNVLPNVSVSFPPMFQFLKGMVHLQLLCNQILVESHTFLLTEFLATETKKEDWSSFLFMSQGKFSIVFLSKYKTWNLVLYFLLLCELSPSVLSIDVGHALQLSKILSIFIKRKVPRSYPSSASFLGRDLCLCFFSYGWFESLFHFKPSFCARLSSSYC
jgi:hypothetical protein